MPQIFTPRSATQRALPRIISPSLSFLALFVFLAVEPLVTLAEVRVVTAQGEHRMGERDTREDAIRLATEAAKRNALEQVATYLESITIIDGLDVTKDEIRTYTAGLVLVLEQDTNTSLDGDTVIVRTDLVAQVDTEDVRLAIAALRENEDARHQLVALQLEYDQLQQDLDAANQALGKASTVEQTQQAAQQRQDILNRVQSNAMVSQAWTDWVLVSPAVYPYSWIGLAQTQALLNTARSLYPTSPHIPVAQQVIITRQPPAPPQPPVPPAPGSMQPIMPSHKIVPGPRPIPLTLNEISHTTPTAPPQIGNQPPTGQLTPQTGLRTLTDIHQLSPLLPTSPSNGAPPNSRSALALQQFLQHQPQTGQSPMTGRLPTINQIYPPTLHQGSRVPHQIEPRTQGGGEHKGGGGRSGGGSHGGDRGGK